VADFACLVDIPTVPLTDAEEEDRFSVIRLNKLVSHHLLLCNTLQGLAEGRIPNAMFLLPPGSAKALALDTPIPTPEGWSTMGDLRVGDAVFDETGAPCRVTWVSPTWRDRPVYRVKTDCGDEIIADREHEWLVRLCGKHPVEKIKETWQLCRRRSKRPMITRAGVLDLPDAPLPIDPYLLGVWLGDGSKASVRITSSLHDQPWLRSELERLGYETRDTSVPTLFQVIGVRGVFASLGLLDDPHHRTYGQKHIPPAYLRASVAQRLALLQGLIDTDGTVCPHRGSTTFCNTNLRLAEQVRELVRSLGVKAGWSESRAMLNGVDHGPVYRISFYLQRSARLPRKAARARNQYRTPNTYIDVEPAGRADTVCIEVDSPSHLFLCGRSMTPTHNSTYTDVVFVPWFMAKYPRKNVILASYATNIARKQGRRARQLIKSKSFRNLNPDIALSTASSAADEWALSTGGEYMAGGLLSGLTGNRAALGIVDDPIAGREEAESQTIRDKTWDAYIDDFCSRLVPGSPQVMILTRWHQDDPAGRILPEDWDGESGMIEGRDGRTWFVVCLPAICDRAGDPLGRQIGETLWPEWFSHEHWRPFQRNPRTWASLYQQRPAPEQGSYFIRAWFDGGDVEQPDGSIRTYTRNRYRPGDQPVGLRKYGASDYAVTEAGGDFTTHRVWGVDEKGELWLMPGGYRAQATSDAWIEAKIDLMRAHEPFAWFGEGGVIQKAIEPALTRRMRERTTWCRLEWLPSIADKPTRARGFQARAAMGMVHLPEGPEGDAFLDELVRFPAGKHDDDVDNASLIGRALDMAHPAIVAEKEKPPAAVRGINEMTWDELMAQQKPRADRV
jgi:predicted phage terminase large subunit-like protein